MGYYKQRFTDLQMLGCTSRQATRILRNDPPRPPCTCRGYDPADPCMHGDTSEGCPRHDPNYYDDSED